MPNVFYNSFFSDRLNGNIDLMADAIHCMLVTALYVPDPDLHAKRSDVSNEVQESGTYKIGGRALENKRVEQDNENDQAVFRADDLVWDQTTMRARGLVLYKARGGQASLDELIVYLDFGKDIVSTNGKFILPWNDEGLLILGS